MVLINLYFTNLLGANNFGRYIFVLSWIILIATFLSSYLHLPIIRFITSYIHQKSFNLLKGCISLTYKYIFFTTAVTFIIFLIILFFLNEIFNRDYLETFIIGSVGIFFISYINVNKSILFGLNRSPEGMFSELIVRPFSIILFILIIYFQDIVLSTKLAISITITSYFVAMLFSFVFVNFFKPEFNSIQSKYNYVEWKKVLLPFIFVSFGEILLSRADIIILGVLRLPSEVGIFAIATLIVSSISMITNAIDSVVSSRFAKLFSKKDLKGAQESLFRMLIVSNAITLPISIIILFFGAEILSLFGEEFVGGTTALRILVGGHLFNSLMGPLGMILGINGQEKSLAKITIISGIINIIILFILVPSFGIEGAALSRLITILFFATVQGYLIWNKTGILPSFLSYFSILNKIDEKK